MSATLQSATLRSQAAADSLMSYETDCLKRKLASVQRMAKQSMARGVVASYASLRIGAHTYSSEPYVRYLPPGLCHFLAKYGSLRGPGDRLCFYVLPAFLPSILSPCRHADPRIKFPPEGGREVP